MQIIVVEVLRIRCLGSCLLAVYVSLMNLSLGTVTLGFGVPQGPPNGGLDPLGSTDHRKMDVGAASCPKGCECI